MLLAPVPNTLLIVCDAVAGLSVLLAPGLHLIPIPIFFGVLLYLGIVSMYGLQMVDRFVMLFMPAKHHPDVSYVRKVRCLSAMYAVREKRLQLPSPLHLISKRVLLLPLIRMLYTANGEKCRHHSKMTINDICALFYFKYI